MVETADGPIDRMDSFEEEGVDANPERTMWNRQLKGKIESAIDDLTPRERMVFELRHYQGLRLRAIGEKCWEPAKKPPKIVCFALLRRCAWC